MADPTRPFLAIYVVWHPAFADGHAIAKAMFDHYRGEPYKNVAGGTGISVAYRYAIAPGTTLPAPIDLDDADTTAIVLLIDEHWADDSDWVEWARDLMSRTDAAGLCARTFPVAIDRRALDIGMLEQAIRWDRWHPSAEGDRERKLLGVLTYQLCRMLRVNLERLKHPLDNDNALEKYLQKVRVFLSHSKHDADGEKIAAKIREYLFQDAALESFFDVHDIPAGLRFDHVLLHAVRVSTMVAIHSDSYSSREWCKREVLEAKRWHVPLIVADAINDMDVRSFPYLGNVPVVRVAPTTRERIETLVSRLLDEVLKDFLWRCRVELVSKDAPADVIFLPRYPELIALVGLTDPPGVRATLVYPDPPLGAEEERLFEAIAPTLRLRSMTEWLAGATP